MKASVALPLLLVAAVAVVDAFPFGRIAKKIVGKGAAAPPKPAPDGVVYVDEDVKNIFVENKKWIKAKKAEDPEFFDTLGSVHKPPYMWIGCADARVPGNTIIGEDAGQVFTVRNVANMVVNTDVNLMSALQYAVRVLKVQHIIVCGHYECGGVRASCQNVDHSAPLENWLRNIRDVYRIHKDELDAISDSEERHRRLVDLNVQEQCINLFKTGVIQRERAESRISTEAGMQPYTTPRVHAVVFDPKTGKLHRLNVNFDEYMEELGSIYKMYSAAA